MRRFKGSSFIYGFLILVFIGILILSISIINTGVGSGNSLYVLDAPSQASSANSVAKHFAPIEDNVVANSTNLNQATMIEQINQLQQQINQPATDGRQFVSNLQNHFEKLYQLDASNSGLYEMGEEQLHELMQAAFACRVSMSKNFNHYISNQDEEDQELLARVYDMNRALRYVEDYVLEIAMKDKLSAEQNFISLQGNGPWVQVPEGQSFKGIQDLQSGDVLLTRGNAFTSAAIARIGKNDTQFSHLSFVYGNPEEDGKLYTVEAHIEIGSVVEPLEVHIDQKNSRTVVYRYEDTDLAHKAAEYMYHKVKTQSDTGENIEYDFSMQYTDESRLFCSEVIYNGFYEISNHSLDIPKHKTRFNPGLIGFLNRMGIPATPDNIDGLQTFSPGDIEYDPRFTLITEWKNPQKLRDSRVKDAILTKMFQWMDKEQYHIHPPVGVAIKSRLTWVLRRTPLLKKLVEKKLPTNMNIEQLGLFLTLDKIGGVLIQHVEEAQAKREQSLSMKEIFELLEAFKQQDGGSSQPKFHQWLHPKEEG